MEFEDSAPEPIQPGPRMARAASLVGILLKRPRLVPEPSNTSISTVEAPPRRERKPLPATDDPAAIVAWWQALKHGRPFPAPEDLDRAALGAAWPAAVLLSYTGGQNGIARATRLSNHDDLRHGPVEYTPMLTEWLLALGRTTLQRGEPVQETGDFPSMRGIAAYRLLALPFSAAGTAADHVLCRLCRA
jgi:hypothetical protein